MVLSMEGQAAQERRVVACIARGVNGLSVGCQHAMGQEDYIRRAVGCMTTSTFNETAAPGERDVWQGDRR